MSGVTLRVRANGATKKMRRLKKKLRTVPKLAHQKFVSETPIRTGNARRNTKLIQGNLIDAKYPYALPLDEGYSKQSPLGMSLPTFVFIKKLVRRIIKIG